MIRLPCPPEDPPDHDDGFPPAARPRTAAAAPTMIVVGRPTVVDCLADGLVRLAEAEDLRGRRFAAASLASYLLLLMSEEGER